MLCPFCKEEIQDEAIKCKHCGSNLSDLPLSISSSINTSAADYGLFLLIIPVISTMLAWFWIGSMSLIEMPGSKLTGLMVITILATAVIASMEASKAKDRKGSYSPTAWFFIITLFWVVGYPAYLYKRPDYGLTNRLIGGILVALVFIGSFAVLGYAIEAKKAEIRSGFEQQMENLGGLQQRSQNREKTEDWLDKGNSLVDQKKYNDAIIAFTKCVEAEPSHTACYLARSTANEAISDYKEAILDYDRIIELRPKDADIYFYRGVAYAQIGDTQQQTDNYKIAAQLGHEKAQELLKKADIEW